MSGPTAESDALDLDAIKDKWLLMCGPCDGGLPMGCTHPDEDYRPVLAALAHEIERLRASITQPRQSSQSSVASSTTSPGRFQGWADPTRDTPPAEPTP